jgi:GntR family transcriptional repressor for pyruvate dehydrogenase complex
MPADLPPNPRTGLFLQVPREPSLSDKVTQLLLETILSGQLRPGDRLPSERDLGEQFGVSRTVIREAVRSLQAKGVVEVRSGSGVRVAAVDAARVSESMRLFLHGSMGDVGYDKVNEVRHTLEVEIAGLAARRASPQDVAELRAVLDRMAAVLDDVEAASLEDVRFHRKIAELTHNELYAVMMDSIGDVLLDIRRATLGTPQRPHRALDYHRRILERIAESDEDGARAAMRAHLDESRQMWEHVGEQR